MVTGLVERPQPLSRQEALTVLLFSYHTLEAYVNEVGARLCPELWQIERTYFRMAVKSVEIAKRDVTLAASSFYPQVQAQVTATRQGNLADLEIRDKSGGTTPDTRQYGLTASLQAWDTGSTFFGVQAARENVKKLQADLAALRLDAGTQVKTAYCNLEDAAKRISVARVTVVSAKEGFRLARDSYEERVGTSTDVLKAQSTLSTAETSLTQALTDYQSALAELYAAMDDDLNTAQALGHVFGVIRLAGRLLEDKTLAKSQQTADLLRRILADLSAWSEELGVFGQESQTFLTELKALRVARLGLDTNRIQVLVEERQQARKAKDFARSDAIRDELAGLGVTVMP